HDIGTVGYQSCSAPPSWCSRWEAVRRGPPWGEGTGAASPAEATAVGVLREAESSGVAASVDDQSRTSTTTTTTAGHSSCSRTSTTPTTGTSRIILTTRTTRTATRIHLTTLLNTATGTVRSTAAMQLPQSELAPESILLAELYDRPFGGARIQPEKRLQVAILALLAVALAAPGLCSSARASAWELDPAATRRWVGRHARWCSTSRVGHRGETCERTRLDHDRPPGLRHNVLWLRGWQAGRDHDRRGRDRAA